MTTYKEKIESAADKYSKAQDPSTPSDHLGFKSGAEWAFKTGIVIDGPKLTEDLVKLKALHQMIFSLNIFTEADAKEYEILVSKYEGLDLMKIF